MADIEHGRRRGGRFRLRRCGRGSCRHYERDHWMTGSGLCLEVQCDCLQYVAPPRWWSRWRRVDSGDHGGEFVSRDYAEANPETTLEEGPD